MDVSSLQQLARAGESERLEFKRSSGQRTDAAKTICGMLNGLGGILLIGIAPDGSVIGQQVSESTQEDIVRELRAIEPPVFPSIEIIPLDTNRSVIAIHVSGGGGPYTFRGQAFMRYGPTTSVMPHERYERMLLERLHGAQRWENQQALAISLHDLDQREIVRTLEEAIRRH